MSTSLKCKQYGDKTCVTLLYYSICIVQTVTNVILITLKNVKKLNEVENLDNNYITQDSDMELGFDFECNENFRFQNG